MTPEEWQRVKPILDSALQLDSNERADFLRQACAVPSLRHEIESLIAAHEQAGSSPLNSATFFRATLTNGMRLGDFQILALLGAGGMGEVYRARDLRLEREVAIKVLPSFVSLDTERLHRFEQEAKAAAALNHPNILAVFQMGSYEEAPYLVSELLEGDTLREQVKRGPMPSKKAVDYAVQIAHGLAAAHEKGIVHRDLKPENLFVTRDGRIKILDFGLAKLLHTDDQTQLTKQTLDTRPGAVMGTVGYMAPEQVRGLPTDHRADIFALGAILYEMLTGKRAFHKPTFADTMSAILNEDPPPISRVIPNVPPALEREVHRCLEKSPEQRFQSASDLAFALEVTSNSGNTTNQSIASAKRRTVWKWTVGAAVALTALVGTLLWHPWLARRLTEKDTIVLADFANTTGDSVFDDTLKQALSIALRQSPFLNALSDQKIKDTLGLMGRSSGERLTAQVAREICQRTGSAAVLEGSISSLGSEFVIGLNAADCRTGDLLAQEQVQASRKEEVLKALGDAATKLRPKLGESLSTVQKFNVPLVQATTSSLEALKAYSLGWNAFQQQAPSAAIPHFRRAIELDPNFALAYSTLGVLYTADLAQPGLAEDNIRKAFELRDRVSESERFYITANYHGFVTGDLEKSEQTLKSWALAYPRDLTPHTDLGFQYGYQGRYEDEAKEELEAIRVEPDGVSAYANLMEAYTALDRLEEAKQVYRQSLERRLEGQFLHDDRYAIAFLEGDAEEMKRQVSTVAGKLGVEDLLLSSESDTEAFYGRLANARALSNQAVQSALRAEEKEVASLWRLGSALREAEFGNFAKARQEVNAGLAMASTRDVQTLAAVALACSDDLGRARALSDGLQKQFPVNTMLINYWLPVVNAYIAIRAGRPVQALKFLETAAPYDLAFPQPQFSEGGLLYPVYVRGQAYLALRQGKEAAAEFQKFQDHRGIVQNTPLASLAHLGLARAYVLIGDVAKARSAYQDFFALWKDADPDIPILKEAKAEFAKLQ